MSLNALVIGEDTRSFLSVIRSLGKQGFNVDVVCFYKRPPSLRSKYIKHTYFLNYQAYTQQQWLDELLKIVSNKHYDIVLPCDERAIFPIYENQNLFPSTCALAIPNKAVIAHLFDKNTTKALAKSLSVPVAKGDILKIKALGYTQLKQSYGGTFVVKPTLSFTSDNLAKRQNVGIISSELEYDAYTHYVTQDDEFLVEEYFSGVGEGVSVLAINGKIQHAFAHTRVNEPRAGGGSSYRKAINIDDGMLEACQKLCKATEYTGVGMFEFKKNYALQRWILIEVNARFWGSLPLAIHAGIDFPYEYASHLLGLKQTTKGINTSYNRNAYARSFSNDLFDSKAEFEFDCRHESKLIACTRLIKRLTSFRRLLTSEKIDSYDVDDKQPFFTEVKQFFDITIGEKIRKESINRHLEMRRLMSCLYGSEQVTIKFICYGNIMRSPLAAQSLKLLCKQVGLTWNIDSFGFHQNQARTSPIECIQEAKKLGIDLQSHRSKWLSQADIDIERDILFIFDAKNKNILDSYYNTRHVFNLAHFIPSGLGAHLEIHDPYGQGNEVTKKCYLLIVEAVKNIFEEQLKMGIFKD